MLQRWISDNRGLRGYKLATLCNGRKFWGWIRHFGGFLWKSSDTARKPQKNQYFRRNISQIIVWETETEYFSTQFNLFWMLSKALFCHKRSSSADNWFAYVSQQPLLLVTDSDTFHIAASFFRAKLLVSTTLLMCETAERAWDKPWKPVMSHFGSDQDA